MRNKMNTIELIISEISNLNINLINKNAIFNLNRVYTSSLKPIILPNITTIIPYNQIKLPTFYNINNLIVSYTPSQKAIGNNIFIDKSRLFIPKFNNDKSIKSYDKQELLNFAKSLGLAATSKDKQGLIDLLLPYATE